MQLAVRVPVDFRIGSPFFFLNVSANFLVEFTTEF